jgi:hypothetical protein
VNVRFFFFFSALLMFLQGAFADGTYQRTKDGKTLIWNNNPKPGDIATWLGGRDAEGYASGFGTLTWYAAKNIPTGSKPALYGRYFGNMVRGKWHSQVNVHARGKTAHAAFVDGNRISGWIAGPAPTWGVAEKSRPVVSEGSLGAPSPPADGPPSVAEQRKAAIARDDIILKPERPIKEAPRVSFRQQANPRISQDAGDKQTHEQFDGFLNSLFEPPSSLRAHSVAAAQASSPPDTSASASDQSEGHPVLTESEVVELAGAEARAKGYDMNKYQLRKVHYSSADDTWSVSYDEKSADGIVEVGRILTLSVEDKAKKVSVVPEK